MAIKYVLQPNTATEDPADYYARIIVNEIIGKERLAQIMVDLGSTFTLPDIIGLIDLLTKAIIGELRRGNAVNIPLFKIRPVMHGAPKKQGETFNPNTDIIEASISAGILIIEGLRKVSTELVSYQLPNPLVTTFIDTNTQNVNSTITPGGTGQLIGEELKFGKAEGEGIYIIDAAGVEVKVTNVVHLAEKNCIFGIPAGLAQGAHTIEIRRAYGTKTLVIRIGALQETLQVL